MVPKSTPRQWLETSLRLWRRHGGLLLGLLWAAALILGYIGFARHALATGRSSRVIDLTYRTLQLVAMNSGDVDGAGWQLDTARFLLPVLAAWTALRALLSLFRDRWQQLRVRSWRDHVIVCGLSRKGWLLAQGFAARGDRVIVIEANKDHALVGPCRERGIGVFTGDATDPDLLCRAGVHRARHLVAVTDDDGVNAEIAVRVQGLLRAAASPGSKQAGRRCPLTCTVHIVDPHLHELARTREMALEEGSPFRLELFNVFDRAARLLWSQFGTGRPDGPVSPPAAAGHGGGCSAHILVTGLGRLGESLVVHAARDWHTRLHESPRRAAGRLRITVVDKEADWKCQALCLRYPRLASVCDLVSLRMNVRSPEFQEGAFLAGGAGYPPVGVAYICLDDDSLGLRTGLAIHQRLLLSADGATQVVVRMAGAGGLARLVEPNGRGGAAFASLHAFGLLDRTCTPDAILGGTHEVLARGLHDVYLEQAQVLGHTEATNPSLVEWERLPEELRESNRAAADGIFGELAALRYTLVPLADWDAAAFLFSEADVEHLARSEHSRFVAERVSQGWRYAGAPKDLPSKHSPAITSWERLSEEERSKALATMRRLPLTLARAGFQIVPMPPSETAASDPPADGGKTMDARGAQLEVMARAIHERYRKNQQGVKPPDDPAMQPWEMLAEHLRESNRQQARDIESTLQRIGCAVRSAGEQGPAPWAFTEDEVEAMAVVAHDHWVEERRRAGWTPGPQRDVERRVTPYLDVAYADLPEDVKEWDRQAVRAIPEVLAAAGLEVVRQG